MKRRDFSDTGGKAHQLVDRIYFLTHKPTQFFLLFLIFIFPVSKLPSQTSPIKLRFRLEKDDVYIIEKYQDIRIDFRSKTITREEKNRIILKVIERRKNSVLLEGKFITYSRTPRLFGDYRLDRIYHSRFTIYDDGRYDVPARSRMPNLRSLPAFPQQLVRPSDRWRLPASEVIELLGYRRELPLVVNYLYKGSRPLPVEAGKIRTNASFPHIRYHYLINIKENSRRSSVRRVQGFSANQLWFDPEQGIPVFDSNRLVYKFLLSDGRRVNFSFKILSWYKKIRKIKVTEKIRIAKEIRKNLGPEKYIKVRKHKNGILLDLNAILFDTDSAHLRPGAKQKLIKIASIINQYPGREIRISGHTDSRGSPSYNLNLSRRRARAVLQELTKNSVLRKRLSYKGFGESRPKSSNRNAKGRAQNRRVEILIVTE